MLEMIAAQASRLSQITEEILLTTQLDRGELTIHHEPVDVGALAQASVDALRQQLPEEVSVEVDVDPGVASASGDADRIQQVLVNLVDNAAKYGVSPVTVHVEQTNGVIQIRVADHGPGIHSPSRSGSSRSSIGPIRTTRARRAGPGSASTSPAS